MTEFPWLASDTPKNWARCEIQDFCTVVRGGSPRPKGSPTYFGGNIPFAKISDVTASDGRVLRMTIDSVNEAGAKKSRLIEAGRIILSNSGTVCVPVFLGVDACIHDGFVAFDGLPKSIEQRFLFHFFKYIRPFILNKHKQGVTQVNLNTTIVSEIQIDIPPTNEQRCIVEKIEAQFDEIDKGVESLHTARATLGLYRQSLLKSAFEGRLTADWRAQNADKLETPDTLLERAEYERDTWHRTAFEEWIFQRLNDIAAIGSGMSVSKSRKFADPIEVPYLRVANVQRGHLDLEEIKTMQIERSQADGLGLATWDVLFNEGGDRDKLGRGWVWESQIPNCITQNHVFRGSPFRHDLTWSQYISHRGNSFGRDYFEKGGKQTTNLASINKTVLKALPVPFCSPAEQTEIVHLLDTRLDAAARLEAEIDAALTRADALRQSILKKAFSGHLVPQDPNDEPASTLLTRIKADRAKSPKPKKRRTAHA